MVGKLRGRLVPLFRMGWFGLAAVALLLLTGYLAPAQLAVGVWKLVLIVSGAYTGYWLDRHMFPYARPGDWVSWTDASNAAISHMASAMMLRRALIVAATILAAALAL